MASQSKAVLKMLVFSSVRTVQAMKILRSRGPSRSKMTPFYAKSRVSTSGIVEIGRLKKKKKKKKEDEQFGSLATFQFRPFAWFLATSTG